MRPSPSLLLHGTKRPWRMGMPSPPRHSRRQGMVRAPPVRKAAVGVGSNRGLATTFTEQPFGGLVQAQPPRFAATGRPDRNQWHVGRCSGTLGRIQILRHRPGIWQVWDRGISRNLCHTGSLKLKESIDQTPHHLPRGNRRSPRHPRACRGLRPLRRPSRCERPDGSIHVGRPFCRVHEREGSEAFARPALARGARSRLRGSEPIRCRDAFRGTEHHLHPER